MKQLCLQFPFKPELFYHHIQIWIVSGAWCPLPGPTKLRLCCAESGQRRRSSPRLRTAHPPDNSAGVYAPLCHSEDASSMKWAADTYNLQSYTWGFCVRLRGSTHTADFTKSVYLLSPKLVCSRYEVCLWMCVCVRPWMHLPPVCITVFLYLCACAASPCLMLYYIFLFCLTWPPLPPAARVFLLPSAGLTSDPQHSRNDTYSVRWGSPHFLALSGSGLACGQGSMPGGDVSGPGCGPTSWLVSFN